VMRAIARSHPTITLDVLASPANASILDGVDFVDQVIVFDKRQLASYLPTALRLRRSRYDAVIDCMVTAPSLTTLLLIFASGARQRIGIAGRGNDAAFTITVPGETRTDAHMVDLLAALAPAFGVAPDTARQPVLDITPAERAWAETAWGSHGRRALINISAGTSERRWPDDRYVALMRHLQSRDSNVSLRVISAPSEADRGAHIAHDGNGSLVPTPSIRHALALVATAHFVFTPDTSIAHAASAFHTPAVAIYVQGKAERWGLYGIPGESVTHPEATMETLALDRVTAAVDRVWDSALVNSNG